MAVPRLKRHEVVGPFRVIQQVSQNPSRPLYLASREDSDELYWLYEPEEGAPAQSGGATLIPYKGSALAAIAAEGSSLATVARLAGALDWRFIVPRWLSLLTEVGYLHARSQLFQQGKELDLNSILFGHEAQLLPLSFRQGNGSTAFSAPELAQRGPTTASDVYALGATLLFLLGGGAPNMTFLAGARLPGQLGSQPGLTAVLKKATDPDPARRFPDAIAFARALAPASPRAEPMGAKPTRQLRIAPLNLVLLFVVLGLGILALVVWLRPIKLDYSAFPFQAQVAVAPAATLPPGELALELSNFQVSPERQVQVDARLTAGGQTLPYGMPVEFSAALNNQKIEPVAVERTAPTTGGGAAAGTYRLRFGVAGLASASGSYRITARLVAALLTQTVFYEEPLAPAGTEAPGANQTPAAATPLSGLTIAGVQVDTSHYPEMTVFFTLSREGGQAARLQGPFVVQIRQDGQVVSQFVLRVNDSGTDPITAALAIDASGSMVGEPIMRAREAAAEFVNALSANDRACIYTFSTLLKPIQPCTTDHGAAGGAVRGIQASGNTALFDTLAIISNDLSGESGRKAIILLSDGADTASRSGKENALARVMQTIIPVYVVGLRSYQFQPAVLKEVASSTGGLYLEAPSASDLQALYARLNSQLQNQYRLTFTSLFPGSKTGTVSIQLRQGDASVETSRTFYVERK